MGFLAIIILAALLWFSDTKLGKALSYFGGVILIIAGHYGFLSISYGSVLKS